METLIKVGKLTTDTYNYIKKYDNISNNLKEKIKEKEANTHDITDKSIDELIKENTKKQETITANMKIISVMILITLIVSLIFLKIQETLIILCIIIGVIVLIKLLPKIKKQNYSNEIMQELPYALRQISIELSSGQGLYDSMNSITKSDYGSLSEEFKWVLEDIHYGEDNKKAFEKMQERIDLEIMDQVIGQIIRTLNTGGDLSQTLTTIADENMFILQMKYKEYSQKLNSFMLIYMFIAVLTPVISFIMLIAASTVMGSIVSKEIILILYLFFFPLIISFIILIVKKFEPKL